MAAFKTLMPTEKINALLSGLDDTKVTAFIGYSDRRSGNNRYGFFECECGNEFEAQIWNVLSKRKQSCGCIRRGPKPKEVNGVSVKQHNLYATWVSMKQRCLNKNTKAYKHYGGRGITVCDRWANSFAAFVQDMGEKPSPNHSIDRINNDGPYSPDNCRWATCLEQRHNQRCRKK